MRKKKRRKWRRQSSKMLFGVAASLALCLKEEGIKRRRFTCDRHNQSDNTATCCSSGNYGAGYEKKIKTSAKKSVLKQIFFSFFFLRWREKTFFCCSYFFFASFRSRENEKDRGLCYCQEEK